MTTATQKINRLCKNFIAAMAAMVAVGTAPSALAVQISGAIFTTTSDGTKVNGNIYDKCCDAYLNGGPQNNNFSGLPPGTYYFQVTDPSGAILLSTDNAVCRQVIVDANGRVHGATGSCPHPNGTPNPANQSTPVELCPFSQTPNAGGEYKVWLIAQTSGTTIDSGDPKVLHFTNDDTKTDNFKCRESVTQCVDDAGNAKAVCISCPLPFTVECQGHVNPDDANAVGALVELPEPIITGGVGGTSEECKIAGVVVSGTIFIPGGTTVTVTCTVTDGAGNKDTCSYDITVNPCPECTLSCPLVPDVCANLPKCQAVVKWDPPACIEAGVTVTSSGGNSGDTFGVGPHTVIYTATMDVDQSVLSTCEVNFNVVAPAAPQITACPTVPAVNGAGQCSATATFTPPTATGNCDGSAITVVCDHASGSSFPIGTTKVTCSATDVCGQSASCCFNVVVKGQICVTKFYDSDFSGAKNGSEVVIPNWKITLSDGQCGYTGTDGKVCFNVVAGTYTVTEELKTGYIATAGTTRTGVLVDSSHCNPSVCIGNVKVANTGALTMGFWQNKNGQNIITSYCAPAGHTSLCAFLRGYAPFQDLSASANCTAVASYVTTIIKAANASGAAMNAMLKAQMLATALDVYFSDPALGGVKITAPSGPIGNVSIDLQAICKMIDSTAGTATCSGSYQNVGAAFGGATCLSVSQLLTYAASQSNAGGSAWYGQVKATQEMAKNTFDAINNGVALACGP